MQVENGRGKFNETELQSVFISTCHCFAVLSPGFDYILCFNFPLQNEPLMYFFFNLKYSKKLLMLLCALKLFGTSWLRVCRDEKKSLPLVPLGTLSDTFLKLSLKGDKFTADAAIDFIIAFQLYQDVTIFEYLIAL